MLFLALPWAFLALAAATAIEPRRARQLDLGPATNEVVEQPKPSARVSNFQQTGYLPPIAPAAAQDDPVVLRPTTPSAGPTHHGRDLCTDPFHSFLCANLRPRRPITGALPGQRNLPFDGNSLAGANTFLEPSKVLAPPLNDLEETTTTTRISTTTPYRPPTTTTRRATTAYRAPPTTTTQRSTTTYRAPPTTTTQRSTTTYRTPPTTTTKRPTTTTTERPIAPEPSNDVRTYLPPEPIAPAAAQQDLTIVKPDATEEHHHHDHPHHHGRDLCSDPFHSFLCEPLKPRKRITGDLPNGLQGQNSFIVPEKVRPEPDINPQPSNEIDRAYLPPTTTRRPPPPPPPPTTPRRPPPTTTTQRYIEPQPSNEIDRAYLPPVTTTRRPPPPPPPTTRRPPPPPTTRRPPPPPTTRRPITIRFRPEPSNEVNRAYLPPTTTTRRPPTTTPKITTQSSPIQYQPSNEVERAYLPPVAPQPSNIDNNYLPPDLKIEPAAAQNDPAIVAPDHDHHHGSHGFKDICSDPFHSFLCTVPKPRTRITGALPSRFQNTLVSPAPSNVDETRVRVLEHKTKNLKVAVIPQDSQAPAPSQQQDTKLPPPVKNEGYEYPKPSNRLPVPVPTPGYSYPKPERKLTLPSEVQERVVTIRTTPKPRPTTTISYSYPKPDNRLTLPSEVKPQVVTGYNYPKPTTTPGYVYPTPENKLTLPSEVKPVIGYDYPKPEVKLNLPSEPKPTKGYDYPKPDVRLTLPSENKPVVGYDYPKPSVGLPLPTTGYNYPTPANRLNLPDQRNNGYSSNQNSKALPLSENRNSQPINTNPSRNSLPSSLKEARERLQGSKVSKISNISNQNSVSDFIPVNDVEFPTDGSIGVRFGERLKRRERQYRLVPPPGSHAL